LTSVDAR